MFRQITHEQIKSIDDFVLKTAQNKDKRLTFESYFY